jgi:hypothetical protein
MAFMHCSLIKMIILLVEKVGDLDRVKFLLRKQNGLACEIYGLSKGARSTNAFGSPSSTKRQGACVEHQK